MSQFIFFLIGVAVGTVLNLVISDVNTVRGTLEINESDPEKDIYQIRIDDLYSLSKKKRLNCKITHK